MFVRSTRGWLGDDRAHIETLGHVGFWEYAVPLVDSERAILSLGLRNVVEGRIRDAYSLGAPYVDVLRILLGLIILEEAICELDDAPGVHDLNGVAVRTVLVEQDAREGYRLLLLVASKVNDTCRVSLIA